MREPARILIADDEPPSRRLLKSYIERHPRAVLHDVVASGHEAVDAIAESRPDIAMLDIEMPELDGFGVLAALEDRGIRCPKVVFVTAYERYAVRAFEIHAVDYLLKPVSYDRFMRAVDRCLAAAETSAEPQPVQALLEDAMVLPPQRLLIRERGRITPVPVNDVDWLEASGDYVIVHAQGQQHLLERSLSEISELLARRGFARVHRGATVNLSCIRELRSLGSGRYELVLRDGQVLTVSRSYAHQFRGDVL